MPKQVELDGINPDAVYTVPQVVRRWKLDNATAGIVLMQILQKIRRENPRFRINQPIKAKGRDFQCAYAVATRTQMLMKNAFIEEIPMTVPDDPFMKMLYTKEPPYKVPLP